MPVYNPSSIPVVGPGTPYVTPSVLLQAPTGISWSSIPVRNATTDQQLAAQLDICHRATALIDGYCNQPLRTTIDIENVVGPDGWRMQIRPNGTARILLSRWPVTQVISAQITAAAAFPAAYTSIAATAFRVEKPLLGVYGSSAPAGAGEGGQAVLLAPGYVSWSAGRGGFELQITYANGWPHGSLTTAATVGATTIQVDDIAGWAGANGVIYDSGLQEAVTCTAAAPATTGALSGPGTLTLASGLRYAHTIGTLVTTLPGGVIRAAILYCVAEALTRGSTATTVQMQPGASQGGGGKGPEEYASEAELLVHPFRRVI